MIEVLDKNNIIENPLEKITRIARFFFLSVFKLCTLIYFNNPKAASRHEYRSNEVGIVAKN